LTLWTPHIPAPERLSAALARARRQAAGKVDVILLDVDAPYLERAGGAAAGIDYTLIFTEHSETGMREADQLAARLDDEAPLRGSVAAVFARVSLDSIDDLPQATRERGLPVLGEAPADYLLAAGDEYSLTSEEPHLPHDTYLGAISRLARALVQIASLKASGRG
jgi:CO dehydrogenase nickel-insertion accessory protein CooC1